METIGTGILISAANNTDSGPNEVDLHGLYVKEAIARTEQAIQDAKQRGDPNVHLIVGEYGSFCISPVDPHHLQAKGCTLKVALPN